MKRTVDMENIWKEKMEEQRKHNEHEIAEEKYDFSELLRTIKDKIAHIIGILRPGDFQTRKKWIAMLLTLIFGPFGIQDIYLKRYWRFGFHMLLNLSVGFITTYPEAIGWQISCWIAVVDFCLIPFSKTTE